MAHSISLRSVSYQKERRIFGIKVRIPSLFHFDLSLQGFYSCVPREKRSFKFFLNIKKYQFAQQLIRRGPNGLGVAKLCDSSGYTNFFHPCNKVINYELGY